MTMPTDDRQAAFEGSPAFDSLRVMLEIAPASPDGTPYLNVAARERIGLALDALDATNARVRELEAALTNALSAMEMQQYRETGEFHIPQHTARPIWDAAIIEGRRALAKEAERDG